MAALVAVVSGEFDIDGLSVERCQRHAHRGPVLPQYRPIAVPSQIAVGDEVGGIAGSIQVHTVIVGDTEGEARLLDGCVVGVLQHGGVFQNEQVALGSVHLVSVADALCAVAGLPVAQSHRGGVAVGHGVQLAAGTRVSFQWIVVYGMTGRAAGRSVVHHANLAVRVIEVAVAAFHTARVEVVVGDASTGNFVAVGTEFGGAAPYRKACGTIGQHIDFVACVAIEPCQGVCGSGGSGQQSRCCVVCAKVNAIVGCVDSTPLHYRLVVGDVGDENGGCLAVDLGKAFKRMPTYIDAIGGRGAV